MVQYFDFTSYNNVKRLSKEKLEELWNLYSANPQNKSYRDALILQYLYIVKYILSRMKVGMPAAISYDDLVGAGIEGLMFAIEHYSSYKRPRFESYAIIRVRGAILDFLRQNDYIPKSIRKKIKTIKDAQDQFKIKYNRMPTTEELSQILGMGPEKIQQCLSEDITVSSLDEIKGFDENGSVAESIEDTMIKTPPEVAEEQNIKTELENALKRLPERERAVLVLYYQNDMTFKEIGETIDLSESRVCQLHAMALMKVKKLISANRALRLRRRIIA